MGWRERIRRGSFTVEASFLYPILVLLIAFMLYLSMGWAQNVQQASEDTEQLREMDVRSDFLESVGQIVGAGVEKAEK